jgi:Bacterial archaeo-eukaryotic release factor family 3
MAVLTREQAQASPSSIISREEIQDLVQVSSRPCVSIYMPTVRAGAQTQQNPIRLKNLLRRVSDRLVESGKREADVAQLLTPIREITDDLAFWQRQNEGLAVFFAPGFLRTFKLPTWVDELALVENRFHLKPLFSLLSGDGQFYILALSLKNIRLIAASRHNARELEIQDVPRSFQEAMGRLTRQYSQFQASTSSKTVSRMPIFHGHGTGEDDLKAEIVEFFNRADKALLKHMDRDCPVVLAGVEYLLPRYKETTEHPKVLDEGLTGNAEGLSAEELRDAAWEIVEPLFLEDRRRAAERYGDLLGAGRSSSSYQEILPAAHDGRVDTLFVARGVRLWGTYDPRTRGIRLQEDQTGQLGGGEDLLDFAAVQTFLNGGKVYAVPQQEVPDGHAMAAVFRY